MCKSTVDGLQVTQLNVDHTAENEDELFRLSQLGEWVRARGQRGREEPQGSLHAPFCSCTEGGME